MARRRSRPTERPAAVGDEVLLDVLRQLESIDLRLSRVEQLMAETELDRLAQAEQGDLIDLRLHSARLAAELSRVTVDLQARIDAVASQRPATSASTPALDLDDASLPAPMGTERSGGWEPIEDD